MDLAEYMREHAYMYSGDNVHAMFRIPKAMIGDAIDMFGMDVRFFDEDDEEEWLSIAATVNEQAVVQFAKIFGLDVFLLEPQKLVDQVKDEMERSIQVYDN